MRHQLERTQLLPIGIDEAWAFFSTPRNLSILTPPELRLVIREPFDDKAAHAGQLIHYHVRPLFSIRWTWTTLIERADAPTCFVDTQLRGPFRYWWHQHTFREVDGGVEMHDLLRYELPLGPMGELAHRPLIRPRLDRIFAYRRATLDRVLGGATRTDEHTTLFQGR